MNNVEFFILSQTDRYVIESISEIVRDEKTPFSLSKVDVWPLTGGHFSISIDNLLSDERIKVILDEESELCNQIHVYTMENLIVKMLRNQEAPNATKRDKITVDLSGLPDERISDATRFLGRLRNKIPAIDSRKVATAFLQEDLKRHFEAREEAVSRLESALQKITTDVAEARDQLQTEFDSKRVHLLSETENTRKNLQEEFNAKQQDLQTQEEALKKIQQEIDDRESRHVRRQIREQIKESLGRHSKIFELTEGTRDMRKTINYFCIGLLILFGTGMIGYNFVTLQRFLVGPSLETGELISLGVKSIAFTAAFISIAVFFIRWHNQWFQQHANEEFRLKRFDLDLDRASWIVEMAMEWENMGEGEEIPPELMQALTQNLFAHDGPEDNQPDPTDHLANALLGSSAEVLLRVPGGPEFRLDRKGIRAMKKHLIQSEDTK